MADQNTDTAISECMDNLLYGIRGKFSSFEDVFWSLIVNEESCTFKSRYCDFYSLASSIVNSENWKDFPLQDLYLSIGSLEKKYHRAASEEAWHQIKHAILFQIYQGVLHETVGVVNDQLPESVAELRNPSSASVIAYRGRVAMLMEKYKIYYMQEGEKAEVLHSDYKQQRDALLNGVVNDSVNLMGIKEFALNREKVLELLKTHHTDAFKQLVLKFIQSIELKALPIPPMFAGMCSNEQFEQRKPHGPQEKGYSDVPDYYAISSASPTNPLGKRKSEEHQVATSSTGTGPSFPTVVATAETASQTTVRSSQSELVYEVNGFECECSGDY